ncbi:MAG: DNA polymerase III subunit gamma/tau [Clostridia bacterium]|nr:DNA polymerase III subunit gamma/tau [Clostridia bacterium]
MSYLALYRRYRPTGFDGIIGQDHVVKTLVNQIETGRLGHAYLFTGTRGTGKTSTAKIFAKAINCEHPVHGSPCGKCAACKALSDPANIDVIEIDAASNNGVNEIRELRDNVQFPPVSCKYKVYIIDEVHMLTGAAFNALLKTLEEPPKHAVFILATTEAHKLPATILSRCMRFDFKLVSTEQIASLIAEIYDEQGKKYTKEAVFAIAKAGEGSIRDALSIADTAISYGDGELTYEDVNEILGSSNAELITQFIATILSGDSGEVLRITESLASIGKSMGVLTKDLTGLLRDLLIVKTCKTANTILGLPEYRFNELKDIAAGVSEARIIRILEIFAETETLLRYTTHPRVVFETAAVKAARPETDYDIDALLARIKALEDKLAKGCKIVTDKADDKTDNDISEETDGEEQEESVNTEEIKGKLLSNLRKMGSEMLWNTMQSVKIEARNGEIILVPKAQEDYALFMIEINNEKIRSALNDAGIEKFSVKEPDDEQQLSEIDDATERLKKIFGEDIVIVKH